MRLHPTQRVPGTDHSEWHDCFLWLPKKTEDGGWAWLRTVSRRIVYIVSPQDGTEFVLGARHAFVPPEAYNVRRRRRAGGSWEEVYFSDQTEDLEAACEKARRNVADLGYHESEVFNARSGAVEMHVQAEEEAA